ncbi:MAG: amidophosphoribosyltransferase [Deferribacteraceae bacterium]|jgi:amidophosphoribosyltransferase|nr:amidophosphoribosyltransferase [Deferribacteraceae bacterium]
MAVAGVYGSDNAARLTYSCLYALQHRGQEGSGIASSDGEVICVHRAQGLVADVYKEQVFPTLKGKIAIGNNKYSTSKDRHVRNLQPLVAELPLGQLAISLSGVLLTDEARQSLKRRGTIFTTDADSEVILHLIAQKAADMPLESAILETMKSLQGGYAVLFMSLDKLIAFRDPNGLKPLILGKTTDNAYVVASETAALDLLNAEYVREIEPGEMVVISDSGVESYAKINGYKVAPCVFEYVYTARPDSTLFSLPVYEVRKECGRRLARQDKVEADLVIPVPDSGIAAAIGYAQESGLPFELGIVRNHYVGRTFIRPMQEIRNFGVKVKLNPVDSIIAGKRIVVVDDSIVRGTTSMQIVQMLKDAGASEVHMRIASPPVLFPCRYGIDTPDKSDLIANRYNLEDIRKFIGATTLDYLTLDNLKGAINENDCCSACFSGSYPLV